MRKCGLGISFADFGDDAKVTINASFELQVKRGFDAFYCTQSSAPKMVVK